MELQIRHMDGLPGFLPLLWAESVVEKSLLSIRKRGYMIRKLRNNWFWDWALGHGLPCLAILRSEGVSVEVDITDPDGFYISTTHSRRHGQKYAQMQGWIAGRS